METISGATIKALRRNAKQNEFKSAPADGESKQERVERLYKSPGGPLMGLLLDEACKRDEMVVVLTSKLGVTYGYINQLRNGIRKVENISQEFSEACARYLNFPTIVVKLLAGSIRLTDFLHRQETEEAAVDRAIRQIQDDPKIRQAMPADLKSLPFEAKKAIALMYSEVSSNDIFGTFELPNILFWLQRAAVTHDKNEYFAKTSKRDAVCSGSGRSFQDAAEA